MLYILQVVIEDELLATVVEDIALLHSKFDSGPAAGVKSHIVQHVLPCHTGLGVRIVLIIGARQQIDELLEKQGEAPQYAAGYRVTDSVAMQTAVQAAGASRMAVEAQLSKVKNPTPITKKFALPDTTKYSLCLTVYPGITVWLFQMQQLVLPQQETLCISYMSVSGHFQIAVAMQTASPFDCSYVRTLLL